MSEAWKSWRGKTPASICRKNGWEAGTRLRGDEGYGPTTIIITAVGEKSILARVDEGLGYQYEGIWALDCRKWKRVKP